MGPALDAWDAVWADDDKTHFNKAVYLFSQILAAVGLGCAKSCIDEGIATATTRTGTIGDHKGAVSGAVEWYTFWILSGCKWQMAQTEWTVCIKYRGRNSK